MYIDEIKPIDKDRVLIISDSGPVFALYKKEATHIGIEEGTELDESEYMRILADILTVRAKKRVMKVLERRDKTENELRDMLARGYYPASVIDAAIEYVRSFGYLDDERYARNYIEYRLEKKSRRQLECELLQRGIDKDIISGVIEELPGEDESERIAALIEKRYKGRLPECLPDRSDEREWARLYRFLLGKGYSYHDIKRALPL